MSMGLHRGWVLGLREGNQRITKVDPEAAEARARARRRRADRAAHTRLAEEVRVALLRSVLFHGTQANIAKSLGVSKSSLASLLSSNPTCTPSIKKLQGMLEIIKKQGNP